MTSRKLAPNEGENPSKRQRVLNDAFIEFRPSFDSLNDDCLLNIVSFLPIDDINTFGTINRRCRVVRRHESLDQTRIATIICSRAKQTSTNSLYSALIAARNVLSDQYTYLRLTGLAMVDFSDEYLSLRGLPHVTKLELVAALSPTESRSCLSFANMPKLYSASNRNVTELVLNGVIVNIEGDQMHHLHSLTDLSLDGCRLTDIAPDGDVMSWHETFRSFYSSVEPVTDHYVLSWCEHLQRLSLKGATWCISSEENNTGTSPPEPISQDMLIKMVRSHQTLRWLRSDLTQENVAMLQEERPEITFVSD